MKNLFKSFAPQPFSLLGHLSSYWVVGVLSYILYSNPFSLRWFADIFSKALAYLFSLLALSKYILNGLIHGSKLEHKLLGQHLEQLIKMNITSEGGVDIVYCQIWFLERDTHHLCSDTAEDVSPEANNKETKDKCEVRSSLLKCQYQKKKEKLWKCFRLKEAKT